MGCVGGGPLHSAVAGTNNLRGAGQQHAIGSDALRRPMLSATLVGAAGVATLVAAKRHGEQLEAQYAERERELRSQIDADKSAMTQVHVVRHMNLEPTDQNFLLLCGAALGATAVGALAFTAAATRYSRRLALANQDACANFLNLRRRRDAEFARFGGTELTRSILPIVEAIEADAASARHGGVLRALLGAHGMQRYDPSVGEPFDADRMLAEVGEAEPGSVVSEVVAHGYSMHGERMVRHARVKVAEPDEPAPEPQ